MSSGVPSFRAAHISLTFNAVEDRLLMWFSGPGGEVSTGLIITRRMAAMLIDAFGGVLATSSAVARKAPGDLRDDIVRMEHQGAVVAAREAPPAPAEIAQQSEPHATASGVLLHKVDIVTRPTVFELVFHAGEDAHFTVELGRGDLHLLIEMLNNRAAGAGWNLTLDTSWFRDNPAGMTLN